ncbi:hypothetical protein XI06_15110 [Bradyrhizobium sp. CCBAU 11434]|uniref:hypothetical protein n=1 Tax=Bradyrhizobium sp. CCBAU 11434 TaxID=1630885 RepID=UPI0023068081|nr:hypothetical protein [Bradyrhizobium sp. CCBAU 11434]MDA9521637.1 hypothetical protein [Bradyrhizobium sp. CCBAU 11434]
MASVGQPITLPLTQPLMLALPAATLETTGSGGPAAPVLAMDPSWNSSQARPIFDIDAAFAVGGGDDLQFEYQTPGAGWSSPTVVHHTVLSGEISGIQVSLGIGALASGNWEARCKFAHSPPNYSGYSNVQPFTIAAAQNLTLQAGTGAFVITGTPMVTGVDRVLAVAPGIFNVTGFPATLSKVAAAYNGPGDVFSSAWAWYSPARAYSSAYAAGLGPVMDVVDQAGANQITINILSTGFVDVASLNAWISAHSVTSVCVKKLYDQSGNGRDVVQATLANMPRLVLSATPLGTLPVLDGTSGTTCYLQTASTFSISQPMTYSAVQKRTSGTANGGSIGAANGATFAGCGTGANLAMASAGAQVTKAATDNAWYALQALVNTTSSALNVGGSDTAGLSMGTQTWASTNMRLLRAGSLQFMGHVAEVGMWTVTSTATDRNNLYANQHGPYGYGSSGW